MSSGRKKTVFTITDTVSPAQPSPISSSAPDLQLQLQNSPDVVMKTLHRLNATVLSYEIRIKKAEADRAELRQSIEELQDEMEELSIQNEQNQQKEPIQSKPVTQPKRQGEDTSAQPVDTEQVRKIVLEEIEEGFSKRINTDMENYTKSLIGEISKSFNSITGKLKKVSDSAKAQLSEQRSWVERQFDEVYNQLRLVSAPKKPTEPSVTELVHTKRNIDLLMGQMKHLQDSSRADIDELVLAGSQMANRVTKVEDSVRYRMRSLEVNQSQPNPAGPIALKMLQLKVEALEQRMRPQFQILNSLRSLKVNSALNNPEARIFPEVSTNRSYQRLPETSLVKKGLPKSTQRLHESSSQKAQSLDGQYDQLRDINNSADAPASEWYSDHLMRNQIVSNAQNQQSNSGQLF